MSFFIRIRDRFLPKYGKLIGLGLLIIFVLVGNLDWIRQDTSPSSGVDANLYMFRTLRVVDRFEAQGLNQIWNSIADLSMAGRPPLYQLMSVPFVLLFGRSMDSGLYVNLLFEILLLVAAYNIGKLAENGKAGLLAAIIVAGYPPLIGLSRVYRPHFAMAGCVALTVWLLLLLQKTRSVKIAWLFGLSLALGLWIHPFFIWAAPIPAVIFCLYIVFFEPHSPKMPIKQLPTWILSKARTPFFLYGLLPASLVSIALVLAWYLTRGKLIINVATSINSPDAIGSRGSEVLTVGFGNIQPSFWWYAITSPHAISTVFVALLGIGIVASLVKRRFTDLMLLILFVAGYTALSLRGTLGWRYFAQLLPVAAALTGIWISRLQNRIVFSILILLCVATAIFNFAIVTWGIQPWNRSAAIALGVPRNLLSENCWLDIAIFCPSPPQDQYWPVDDILRTVLNDPECKSEGCDLLVITQTARLNWSSFEYYLIQDYPERKLSILSPGGDLMGTKLNLDALLNSEYIAYESVGRGRNFISPAINLLQSTPPAFADAHKEVSEFRLPDERTVVLIKRIKPLTAGEAESTRLKYLKEIGYMYLSLSRTDKAIVAFQDVLKINPNDFEAHIRLAKIFQDKNDCVAAIPHWLVLLMTQKTYGNYSNLGDAYLKCGDFDNAISAYKDALKLKPGNPRVRFGLGMAYAAQGEIFAATRQFQKVIQYAPGSEYAQQAQKWLDTHK